ncbi:hypothetical protein HDA32_004715 [Spinactinospora alkalitolerans]|uniref:Uncharacterized protein n=1 Tax=Spinactinospora alkalitolerans TaxID=687207 RepID=A0A852U229_9ACTN|nr:hypothetical protein [Spinactinospora alkalitolerans]
MEFSTGPWARRAGHRGGPTFPNAIGTTARGPSPFPAHRDFPRGSRRRPPRLPGRLRETCTRSGCDRCVRGARREFQGSGPLRRRRCAHYDSRPPTRTRSSDISEKPPRARTGSINAAREGGRQGQAGLETTGPPPRRGPVFPDWPATPFTGSVIGEDATGPRGGCSTSKICSSAPGQRGAPNIRSPQASTAVRPHPPLLAPRLAPRRSSQTARGVGLSTAMGPPSPRTVRPSAGISRSRFPIMQALPITFTDKMTESTENS